MPMQVTETSIEGLKRQFTFVIPANDVELNLLRDWMKLVRQ